MTYIEFYDASAVENVCACLTCMPERVILVGDSGKTLQKCVERYSSVLEARGENVEFLYRSVNRNCMESIIGALSEIVETYDDCVFDLTGGEELYLVATGIISERYRDKHIQMHRFNIRTSSITDCDLDGVTIAEKPHPELSVEENIRVYGGDIVWDDVKQHGTHRWVIDDCFRDDINKMWDICRHDVREWNLVIGALAEAYAESDGEGLTVTLPTAIIVERSKKQKGEFDLGKTVIGMLYYEDLITDWDRDEVYLTVHFKNAQIKRCLTKAGLVLEMKVYSAAHDVCEKNGAPYYNSIMNGVCIDWDGKIHAERESHDTENEIDVMLMRGIIPVFVSCKNGNIEMEELYKLDAVADRFGGKYARRVLVATALEDAGHFGEYLRMRASDMGIKIVDNLQELDDVGIKTEIRNFMIGK